ncbi:hypothetical protein DICSQDRAFT_20244, partial [Dichomitus squalens LYAD-421 SS1]
DYDIIAIQEPFIDHLNLTRANPRWSVVYPTGHHDSGHRTRSIVLVNTRISSNAWHPIKIPSPDVTAVTIVSQQRTVHIFNLY